MTQGERGPTVEPENGPIVPSRNYDTLKAGDVIQFSGSTQTHLVTRVDHRAGSRGMGGMDMGTPPTTQVWFGNQVLHYDPWRARTDYSEFYIIKRGDPQAKLMEATPFFPAWNVPVKDIWGNRL